MSLLPEIPNPYLEAFAIGLLYGLVFYTSACLPYVTSYIAGILKVLGLGTLLNATIATHS